MNRRGNKTNMVCCTANLISKNILYVYTKNIERLFPRRFTLINSILNIKEIMYFSFQTTKSSLLIESYI